MQKLYPEADLSYDLTGIFSVEHVGTLQDEGAEDIESYINNDNYDALACYVSELSGCLEHDNPVTFENARGCLRGDWLRFRFRFGDFLIFKQLGLSLYSVYLVNT